ncbi:hypothetical protein J2Z32_000437 [Paenibacillus turicensis]|uniref:Uncharacterized protein n=1 Tax=Paenibacillus turicensis TaxID=160487 RepID=A0ABS4FMM2_9BACL|nr:hypothetical protein [Paenibacillus turicensis]
MLTFATIDITTDLTTDAKVIEIIILAALFSIVACFMFFMKSFIWLNTIISP